MLKHFCLSGLSDITFEKTRGRDFQRASEIEQHEHVRGALAALDQADEIAVKIGSLSEPFLAQAPLFPQPTNLLTKDR